MKKKGKKTLQQFIVASDSTEVKSPVTRVNNSPGLLRIEEFLRKLELSTAKTRKILDILEGDAHPLCGRKEIYTLHS